jgi:hypothetical protein
MTFAFAILFPAAPGLQSSFPLNANPQHGCTAFGMALHHLGNRHAICNVQFTVPIGKGDDYQARVEEERLAETRGSLTREFSERKPTFIGVSVSFNRRKGQETARQRRMN